MCAQGWKIGASAARLNLPALSTHQYHSQLVIDSLPSTLYIFGRKGDQDPTVLTLPCRECRGFFLHPEGLPLAITGQAVEVPCPEAFTRPRVSSVPVCPTVQEFFCFERPSDREVGMRPQNAALRRLSRGILNNLGRNG